jgi:hypothetical protein
MAHGAPLLPVDALSANSSAVNETYINLSAMNMPDRRTSPVTDPNETARMAALWMMHSAALSRLLRAHGRDDHADSLEAALGEVGNILTARIGETAFTDAMDWASAQLWDQQGFLPQSTARH